MEKLSRQSIELIKRLRTFQVTDLIGLGRILGIEENMEFEDFITKIIQ